MKLAIRKRKVDTINTDGFIMESEKVTTTILPVRPIGEPKVEGMFSNDNCLLPPRTSSDLAIDIAQTAPSKSRLYHFLGLEGFLIEIDEKGKKSYFQEVTKPDGKTLKIFIAPRKMGKPKLGQALADALEFIACANSGGDVNHARLYYHRDITTLSPEMQKRAEAFLLLDAPRKKKIPQPRDTYMPFKRALTKLAKKPQ